MNQKEYVFKGFSWSELGECWGITVEEQPLTAKVMGEDKPFELGTVPEKIDKAIHINGSRIVFTLVDEEEVLAEKIKQHLWANIDLTKGNFKDSQMRTDIHNFLKALIEEEHGFDTPIWEALLKIESDHTLTQWITSSFEKLWT